MSFVLNKNINLKYIFGRKCPPTQTVILSMQSGDIYIFPCHPESIEGSSGAKKNKQDMRLTARCFDRLNMTRETLNFTT